MRCKHMDRAAVVECSRLVSRAMQPVSEQLELQKPLPLTAPRLHECALARAHLCVCGCILPSRESLLIPPALPTLKKVVLWRARNIDGSSSAYSRL